MKWAVLGTGFIANKVINLGIRRAGHDIVAVGSRSIETAQAFADKNGIATAYGSYQEVLDDANVDAVYIATPSMFHEEWVIKAAKAKKHVLCEKPVAPTLAQVQKMIQICRENGVVFLDGTFFKHHPRTEAIKKVISDGEIGRVSSVHSHFSFLMAPPAYNGNVPTQIRINPATEPTGVLGDMAWYTVRFGLIAYGYNLPKSVSCTIVQKNQITGAAEHVIGHMLFSDNRVASFEASFTQVSVQTSSVTGDKGALSLKDTFLTTNVFPITKETALSYNAAAMDAFEISTKRGEWERREIDTGGVVSEEWMARHFAECVAGARDWEEWARETVVIHTVLDKLWESASADGKAVSM